MLETLALEAGNGLDGNSPCRVRWEVESQLDDQLAEMLLAMAREAFDLAAGGLSLRLSERAAQVRFDVQYRASDDHPAAAALFARLAELSAPFDGRLRMESQSGRGALLRVSISLPRRARLASSTLCASSFIDSSCRRRAPRLLMNL